MNQDQFSDIINQITKRFEEAFSVDSQPQKQEHYDPNVVLKMAISCETNSSVLLMEITELITLFLMRGPKISKSKEGMKDSGRERVAILTKKYKLKDFASAEEVASGKALSLKKLIPAFPYQFLVMLKTEKYSRPLSKEILDEAKASNFPGFLKNSTFLSIIPFPNNKSTNIWSTVLKFSTVIEGIIAYEFLESFVVHKWGNSGNLLPIKALINVMSVAQNILNSNFIHQEIREKNFLTMFQKDLNSNFKAVENLILYTEKNYPGFKDAVSNHFYYDIKNKNFGCTAKIFCRHVER